MNKKEEFELENMNIEKGSETRVPKYMLTGPVFCCEPQKSSSEAYLPDGSMWKSGVPNPFNPEEKPSTALTVTHGEVLFKILHFFRANMINYSKAVDISLNQLLRIVGWKKSAANIKRIKLTLSDLKNTWHSITKDEKVKTFTILTAIGHEKNLKTSEEYINYISFYPKFIEMLEEIEHTLFVQLDVLESITSNIAKTIYLYLPSRARHHDIKNPFKITLTKVLQQIGKNDIPQNKSSRKKIFTQNKNSIIKQLDNSRIQLNWKLKVKIELTKDKKDYNLVAWTEKIGKRDLKAMDFKCALFTWFISGGGSKEEFKKSIRNLPELDGYEIENLENAEINIKENEKFLRMAKAILPEFPELCGEIKHKYFTDQSIRNTTAYFIGLVRRNLTGELF